jgi:ABC-2 type transport system permease protein
MAADALPVMTGVLSDQRRSLLLWSLAAAAVTAIYVGFYPAMGDAANIEVFLENMPQGLVEALRYDQIATPAGYLLSTVYGLLGPVLLLVFAIGTGARLIAGQEEDGTLELELTAPVARVQLLAGRLLALWTDLLILVAVITGVTALMVLGIGMDVGVAEILAAGVGLWLIAIGFGTIAMAIGAATGRRTSALGGAAGLAVVSYILDAIGPTIDAGWMTAVSPFSWFLEPNPLAHGLDLTSIALLAALPLVAAAVGLATFNRRDLMV